jgi:hypothetical protein
MMDRYKKKKNIDFDIFLEHNHYEECTGGELKILKKKNQMLKAYVNAINNYNQLIED